MTHEAALLDVNVLVALAWRNHVHHAEARQWFDQNAPAGWATTPTTEVGFVRVSSNRAATRTRTTPATAITMLTRLTALAGHVFWPDSVRHVTADGLDPERVVGYRQVTDAHLLAVAAANHGRLVTLDGRIAQLVDPGSATLEVIPTTPPAVP
jgi:toxin-antitoxin system PIN domain toxin